MILMTSFITAVPFFAEALTPHTVITIDGDTDLDLLEFVGSGTSADPYIIEDLSIDAGGANTGILISGTTVHIIIRGCQITGTSVYGGNGYGAIGLVNAQNVQVVNNDCSNNPVYGINAYRSSNILISGNTLNGNKYGVTMTECSASTVVGNTIVQTATGYSCISLTGTGLPGDGVLVSNNLCTGVTGISLQSCPGYTVIGNAVSSVGSGGSGIYTYASSGCTVDRNSVTGFNDGIGLWDCSSSQVSNNTLSGYSNNGIRVDLSALAMTSRVSIENNTLTGGGSAIIVRTSTFARVVDNICRSFIYTGISLASYSSDGQVSRNTCTGGQSGIIVSDFSDRCVISENDCTDCKRGIDIMIASHCQVKDNDCSLFKERGIGLTNAPYTLVSGNDCSSGTGSGIIINENSGSCEVRYNTCSYNTNKGIYIGSSATLDVAFNTVIGNRGDGVYITSSFGLSVHGNLLKDNLGVGIYINSPSSAYVNDIYWNNFIGNNYATTTYNAFYSQAYDNGNSNWNRTAVPLMGNYWADYASQGDEDGDGIVDTGYRIGYNGARTDAFPLVSMWYPAVPDAPTGLVASAGSQYAVLDWSAPAYDGGDGIDYYIVYQDGLEVLRTSATEATITGLDNGQTYVYVIAAHNRIGASALSNEVTVTPDTSLPTAPTGLQATFGDGSVTLTWTGPPNDGGLPITDYLVYQDGSEAARTSGTEITLSGLTNGRQLSFKVAAENSKGRGEFSNTVFVTPLKTHSPIRIDSDAQLMAMAAAEGWPGDGSEGSPYIIQGYGIDADGAKAGLFIGNTTLHLVISQCYITDASPYNDVAQGGLVLYYATNVDIIGTNCSDNPVNGIVLYHSNGNSVTGCSAFGNYIGLRVDFSDNVQVANNRLSGNSYAGLVLEDNCNGGLVSGNVMNGNAVGAVFRYAYDVTVSGNTIADGSSSTSAGIYIDHCSGLSVEGNELSDNGYGIDLHSSGEIDIKNNIVLRSAQAGMRIGDSYDDLYSDGNTIEGNTCSDGAKGVQLAKARDTVLRNNLIEDNTGSGISVLEGSDRAVVRDNDVHGNYDGVQIANSNDVQVFSNDLSDNDRYGLQALLSSRTVIDGNDASGCGEVGIALNNAPYTVISGNTCSNNIVGIRLVENSGSCQITDNTVTGNSMRGIHVQESASVTIDGNLIAINSGEGIYLHTVFDTTVTGNEIEDNAGYGVCIISPSSTFINAIYGNTFRGNNGATGAYSAAHVQAYDGGNSVWNGTTTGNRWLDLTVPDASDDGTVDVPYLIDGHQYDADKARDLYPQAWNIVVVSPASTIYSGTSVGIAWTSIGDFDLVSIELYRDGTLVGTLSASTPNDGAEMWEVPLGTESGTYSVKISAIGEEVSDMGPSFQIERTYLEFVSPAGGERWYAGSGAQHVISWSHGGAGSSVTVSLYRDGAFVMVLSESADIGTPLLWAIPAGIATDDSYTIRIASDQDARVFDESPAFTIASLPAVLAPNGGELVEIGSTMTISWAEYSGPVDIVLLLDSAEHLTIASGAPNTGSFLWTVPGNLAPGGYSIRVVASAEPECADASNSEFTVTEVRTVAVTSPVGGTLSGNEVREITWTSTGLVPTVTIELYRNGELVATIASSVANTGSFGWIVPTTLPDAQGYSIVIYDPTNTVCRDAGGEFAITGPQAITVLAPSGETWNAGTTHTISWSTTGLIGSVTVGVYLDGTLVADLGTLGASVNEVEWTIPLGQQHGSYSVKVTSVLYPEVWGESKLIIEGLPEAPSLSVEAGNAEAHLSWTAPEYLGPGPVTYAIYRDGTYIGTASGLTYDDSGLINGMAYRYRVAAVNTVGEGPTSNTVTVTPFRPNTAPVATLASSSVLGNGATVFYFDASASYDNENDALEYCWSVDGGEWSEWSSISVTPRTFSSAGEHVITVEVRDKDGLSSQSQVTVLVDNDAPIIEYDVLGTAGENGWFVSSVTVSAITDDTSGISGLMYSVNGGSWVPFDSNFEILDDGLYEVALKAIDLAGNEATVYLDVRIDTAAPIINGWTVEAANAADWFSSPVTVQFEAFDELSGAAVTGMEAILENEGAGQFVTWAVRDLAGNSAELTIGGVNIDMTAPVTSPYVNGAPLSGPLAASDRLELVSSDGLSGAASVEYRIGDDIWTVISGGSSGAIVVPGGTYDLYFRSVDLAGNIEEDRHLAISIPVSTGTRLQYSGALSGQVTDAANLAAMLTDAQGNGIAGIEVTFVIGTQTVTAVTGADGVAVASVVLDQAPGFVPVSVYYAGDAEHQASSAEAVFAIVAESATVTYTGEVIDRNLFSLRATFSEQQDGSYGSLADAAVTFNIYAPSSLTSPVKVVGPVPVTWTANGIGVGSSTVYLPEGNFIVVAIISGDSYEGPTSHLVVLTSYSGTGTLVAGGGYISDPSGGQGSFGFMVRYDRFLSPRASLVYTYTENGEDRVFVSKMVSQLTLKGSHLVLYGTGSVFGYDSETGSVTALATGLRFQADGWDNGRGADVFMISLYRASTYHDAGYRPLGFVAGDILIKRR